MKAIPRSRKGAVRVEAAAQQGFATSETPATAAEKLSSADPIVAEILRGLYDGRYVAGQKLTESDLTRRFGVGRSSVREALRRLAAEGIVTVSLHRGASIRLLSRQDVRDVLEVIEALSGLSARLAAVRVSRPEDEQALRETLASMSDLSRRGDPFEFARMRNRFYRQLAQMSGNRELASSCRRCRRISFAFSFERPMALRLGGSGWGTTSGSSRPSWRGMAPRRKRRCGSTSGIPPTPLRTFQITRSDEGSRAALRRAQIALRHGGALQTSGCDGSAARARGGQIVHPTPSQGCSAGD